MKLLFSLLLENNYQSKPAVKLLTLLRFNNYALYIKNIAYRDMRYSPTKRFATPF